MRFLEVAGSKYGAVISGGGYLVSLGHWGLCKNSVGERGALQKWRTLGHYGRPEDTSGGHCRGSGHTGDLRALRGWVTLWKVKSWLDGKKGREFMA